MRVPVAVLALVVLVSVPALALEPGVACQGRKLRATGKAARALVGCAAETWDASVPTHCDWLAAQKLVRTFGRADAARICLTVGDGPEIGDRVDSFASTVASAFPAAQPRPSACVANKLRAVAEKFFALTTAHARDRRRPDPARLAAALARADAAFLAAWDAANALGGCIVSDEEEKTKESGRVDIWMTDFLRRLYPTCGDGVRAGTEECDGNDAASCPGRCATSCTCPICGNGTVEPGEQCDGTADALCPGLCTACDCPGPPICGDNVREVPEQCDGSAAGCEIYGGFANTCVAPSQPSQCSCCSNSVCNFEGFPIPCCPGFHCVSTGGPHVQAICVSP